MQNSNFLFITGPMFAGKTQKLIRMIRYHQKHHSQKKALIFKPYIDQRFKNNLSKIISHNFQHIPAFFVKDSQEILTILQKKLLKFKVSYVFISEINLFSTSLLSVFKEILAQKITLICDGLSLDFQKNYFPVIEEILTLKPQIQTLSARCFYCSDKAFFSQRTIASKKIILVGTENIYRSVCEKCHGRK